VATLSEQRTDSLRESSGYAIGNTGGDRSLVFDDLLVNRPRRVAARTLTVLLVAAIVSLGVWATAAGAFGGVADDCLLVSGTEYGGVTLAPSCGDVSGAPVQASAPQHAVAAAESRAVASSQLWLPMPRLVVELVAGVIR